MATIIAGIGQQNSFEKVLDIALDELGKTEGQPRRILAESDVVKLTADRSSFDGKFECFTVQIDAMSEVRKNIHQVVDAAPEGICEYIEDEEEGHTTLTLPVPGHDNIDYDIVRDTLEDVFKKTFIPEVWRFNGERYNNDPVSIELLFRALIQYKASDIHLSAGEKPIFRIDNKMLESDLIPPLSGPQIYNLVKQLSPDDDWIRFEKEKQNSFSFHQKGIGFARASAFMKSGQPHLTFRYHPEDIPSFDMLNMPGNVMEKLAKSHNGLICIVGMTGSGKSSTCAALLDWINRNRKLHILTLEDPVEYHHYSKKSTMSQRNLGKDFPSFAIGVEGALRHDPDVILVGEMRDAATIRAAIGAAATGHLVLTTLHANDAATVIDRICSFFDPIERELIRSQLCDCIQTIICQKLVVKKGGGRVPTLEVLYNDVKQISRGILEGNTNAIRLGMQQNLCESKLFEFYLYDQWKDGLIELETAQEYSPEISMFEQIRMGTYTVPKLA